MVSILLPWDRGKSLFNFHDLISPQDSSLLPPAALPQLVSCGISNLPGDTSPQVVLILCSRAQPNCDFFFEVFLQVKQHLEVLFPEAGKGFLGATSVGFLNYNFVSLRSLHLQNKDLGEPCSQAEVCFKFVAGGIHW